MKRLLLPLTWLLLAFLTAEVGLRLYFATKLGASALYYGLVDPARELTAPDSVRYHANVLGEGAYSKYFPNQRKFYLDPQTRTRTPVSINRHGFRGDDFATAKRPGVIRVVTLGASSTFGYGARDDETYPHYLERILNDGSCPGVDAFEVLNLGIPHLKSAAIASLFLAEGIPLEPDAVTFYEGVNDSKGWPDDRDFLADRLGFPASAARSRLLSVRFASSLLESRDRYTQGDYERQLEGALEGFLASLERIRQAAQQRGIALFVASQPAKSLLVGRDEIRGMSFATEAELVRLRLLERGELTPRALYFLVHVELMRALERWAAERGVAYVDAIRALDRRRDELLSYVHLSPEGNRIVAQAFAGAIAANFCRGATD